MIKNRDNIINENVRGLPTSTFIVTIAPPIAPIQIKFEQTIANLSTLNKNQSLCNRGLDTQFTYNIARIQALFQVIYREGVITPQDYETIETVSNELTKLEESLKNQDLSLSDRIQSLKYIKEARLSVRETHQLAKSLEAYYPLADEFDAAIGAINDRTQFPFYRGECLMAAPHIKKASKSLEDIRKLANSFPDKSAAKIRLNSLLIELEKEWKFTLEEWEEELFNDVRNEINDFIPNRKDFAYALKTKIQEIIDTLHDIKSLAIEKRLTKIIEPLQVKKSSLQWGDDEWIAGHPLTPEIEPKEWGEGTKRLIHSLLVGMQLTEQAIHLANSLDNANLRQRAQQMQDNMRAAVKPEILASIEKDAAFLGTLLSDKYEDLKNTQQREHLTRRHPAIRPCLDKAMTSHGDTAPSREQILDLIEAYVLKETVAASPSAHPFALRSLEEWWKVFSTEEETTEKPTEESVHRFSGKIRAIGSGLISPSSVENTQDLVAARRNDYIEELKQATATLSKCELALLSFNGAGEKPDAVQDHIQRIYQELIHTAQNLPPINCSLTQLAAWNQKVHDLSYAVKSLDKQMSLWSLPKSQVAQASVPKQSIKQGSSPIDLSKATLRLTKAPPAEGMFSKIKGFFKSLISSVPGSPFKYVDWRRLPDKTDPSSQIFNEIWSSTTTQFLSLFSSDEAMWSSLYNEHNTQIHAHVATTLKEGKNAIQRILHDLEERKNTLSQKLAPKERGAFLKAIQELEYSTHKLQQKEASDVTPLCEVIDWTREVEAFRGKTISLSDQIVESTTLALRNEQSLTELKAFIESPPISIDKRQFLHLIGDLFGQASGLEGDARLISWEYRLQILKARLAVSELPDEIVFYQELIDKIEQGKKVYTYYALPFELYAKEMRTTLEGLKPGETVILEGGWDSFDGGHALLYEIRKQENGNYAYTVYNSGAGLGYFTQVQIGVQDKSVFFVEQEDISPERLLSGPVLKTLWDLQNTLEEWNEHDIFKAIFPLLGGKYVQRIVSFENIKTAQRSGTCTMMSLVAWLYDQSTKSDIARLQFEHRFKAIVDFFNTHKNEFESDEQARELFEKSLREFSQETVKAYAKQGVISPQELEYTLQVIGPIHQESAALLDRLRLKWNAITPAGEPGVVESLINSKKLPKTSILNEKPYVSSYEVGEISFVFNLETLHTDLLRVTAEARLGIESGTTHVISDSITNILAKIPLDISEHITPEQAKELVISISAMGKMYAASLLTQNKSPSSSSIKTTPKQHVSYFKLITLAYRFAQKEGNPYAFRLPPLLVRAMQHELAGFSLYDPDYDQELMEIVDYWNSDQAEITEMNKTFFSTHDSVNGQSIKTLELGQNRYQPEKIDNEQETDLIFANPFQLYKENPEIQSIVQNQMLDYEIATKLDISVFLFADSVSYSLKYMRSDISRDRDVFPSTYYEMRDLFALSLVINTHSTLCSRLDLDHPVHFIAYETDPNYESPFKYKHWKIYFKFFDNDFGDVLGDFQGAFRQKPPPGSPSTLLEEWNTLFVESGYKISKRHLPLRHEPNQALVDLPSISGINLQELRDLASIRSEPSQQVERGIAYFTQPYILSTFHKNHVLLDLLLFEPGILLNHLEGHPEEVEGRIKQLAEFCEKGIVYFREFQKNEDLLLILRLNRRLAKYINYTYDTHKDLAPIRDKVNFPEPRKLARKLMKDESLPMDLRVMAAGELVLTYENTPSLNHAETVDLLQAAAFFKCMLLNEKQANPLINEDIRKLLDDKKEQIRIAVEKNPSLFFNEAFELDLSWHTEEYPVYISEDKQWLVDIYSGNKNFMGAGLALLPNDLVILNTFNKLFPNPPMYVRQNNNFFYLEDKNGFTYRATSASVERLIEGKWFKHFDYWTFYPYLPSHLTHEFVEAWVNANTAYFTNSQSGAFIAKITNDNEIIGIDKKGQPNNLKLGIPPELFTRIEDPNWIRVWKDGSEKIVKVELPQLNLEFETKLIKGTQRLCISDPQGYYLASNQFVSELRDFPHYLLLENNQGNQFVLFPMRELDHREGSLTTETLLQKRINPSENTKLQNIPPLKLKINSNQQLLPKNNQERFFLALVYLKKHDYSKAQDLLKGMGDTYRGHRSHVRGFNSDEESILGWIFGSTRDPDPRAISIRFRALYLLKKNNYFFPKKDAVEKFLNFIKNVDEYEYEAYLNVIKNVAEYELDIDEELFILSLLSTKREMKLKNRHQFLLLKKENQSQSIPISNEGMILSHFLKKTSEPELQPAFNAEYFQGHYQRQKGPDTHSLLRPHIMRYFVDIYALMTNELTIEEARKVVEDYGGFRVSSEKIYEELKREMLLCLALSAKGTQEPVDLGAILALIAIYNDDPSHPNYVPSKELREKLNVSKWEDYQAWKSLISILKGILEKGKEASHVVKSLQAQHSEVPKIDHVEPRLHKRKKTSQAKQLQAFEQSTALYPPSQEITLKYPDLKEKLVVSNVTQSEQHGLEEVKEELTFVFSLNTNSTVANRLFTNTQASIENYISKLKPEALTKYEFKSPEAFHTYKQELGRNIKEYEYTLNNEVARLLALANKDPLDLTEIAEKQLKVISGDIKLLSHNDLILLFLKCDVDGFHRRNPALTQEEIALLNQETLTYLISATHLQYMQRQMKLIEEIETTPSAEDRQEIVQKLVVTAQSKREYQPHEHPAYLVFEFFMDILLYEKQVENISNLRIHNGKIGNVREIGKVLEMMTGAGKTDVLLILLAYLNANGDNLSIIVLTKEMLSNVGEKVAVRLGVGLDKEVQTTSFSRDTIILKHNLEILLSRLNQIREERQVLMLSNDDIMSLYLKMIETFMLAEEAANTSSEIELHRYKESLEIFVEIFGLFHKKGVVILDEIDAILAAIKQYLFTLQNTADGQPKPITPIYSQFVLELYRSILTNPEWHMNMEFHPNPEAPTFTIAYFNSLKEAIVKNMINKQLFVKEKNVRDFFFKLSPEKRTFLEDYVMGRENNEAKEFVMAQDKTIRALLDLAYGQINTLLTLTIGKRTNKQYGLDETGNKTGALPYDGYGNPLPKNRFGLCYEDLNYSIQIYLKEGIPLKFIEQGVQKWQEDANAELKANKRLLPSQTEKQRFIDDLFGKDIFNILTMHKKIGDVKKEVDLRTTAKLDFIEKYVLNEIEYYPLFIAMGPQIYGWLFKLASGFTATTFNAETFPHTLSLLPDNISAGRTLTILWKNREESILSLPRISHLDADPAIRTVEITQHLASHIRNFTDYTAMIDMGGFFRDILDNEKIVEAWLNLPEVKQKLPNIVGGHYFDANNNAHVVDRNKKNELAAESNLDKSKKLFYFALKQIIGIDEKLPLATKALVFVGPDTTIRELLQAVGRLRGLGGQLPYFVVPDEVKDMIRTTLNPLLKTPIEKDLKLEHILLFVAYNQAMLQGEDNFRSFKQKLTAVLHEAFNEAVIDKSISIDEKIELFRQIKDLFAFKVTDDPTVIFGNKNVEKLRHDVVVAELKKQKESKEAAALKNFPPLKNHPTIQNIDQRFDLVVEIDEPLQSEVITTNTNYGNSLQVQTETKAKPETKVDTQTNTQTQTETDTDFRFYNRKYKPFSVELWPKEEIFNQELYLKINWPILNLNKAIGKLSVIKSSPFDADLLTTTNLMSINNHKLDRPPYAPFNYFQKNVDSILVIQNKKTGVFTGAFIDQNDTEFLRDFLIKDQGVKNVSNRGVKLCLISMQDSILLTQGKERIDVNMIESDAKVKRWLVQAKFFNGVVDYSDEELALLEEWFKEKGIGEMKEFFLTVILKFKPLSKIHFPLSTLEKLFKRLAEKPRMTVLTKTT